MNRRDFLMMGAATAGVSGLRLPAMAAEGEEVPPPKVDRKNVKPRNRIPYAGIDWGKAFQINGTTHMHAHNDLPRVVKERNIGFLTASNYYPSRPIYPWRDQTYPIGVPVSDWPVMVNGKLKKGPFDWNKIVSEWENELDEKSRKSWPPYPFKKRGKTYSESSFPADMLEAPNAEHHGFRLANGKWAGRLHICAPGSAYISGTFDARNRLKTSSHGYCFGSGEFWGTAIDRMIEKLILPDGGGVTINHPTWSRFRGEFLLELLDWDPRVLGIEVLESAVNSEHYWDWVLSTGRQCYGFFVPDHGLHKTDFGVCVLVVPERTQEACLRAYRNGNFYGAAHGLGELKFTLISFDGKVVRASTDKPATFEIKTSRGVVQTTKGTSVEWTVPKDDNRRNGPAVEVFARVKATAADGSGETLFSQAFMLV